jgi:hypothetical protein
MMVVRRRGWKEAMHDELDLHEVDPRPLQDEQLHSQADEVTFGRQSIQRAGCLFLPVTIWRVL